MGGWKYEDFVKAFDRPGAKYLDEAPIEFIKRYAKECADLQVEEGKKRILALETAIKTVLDDSESKPGGWGPDHTMTVVLANALNRKCDECGKPCDCTERPAQHLNHLCRSKGHNPGWYE